MPAMNVKRNGEVEEGSKREQREQREIGEIEGEMYVHTQTQTDRQTHTHTHTCRLPDFHLCICAHGR